MDCPACQNANLPGQKFCGACGHALEMACPQCGVSNPPHYKFCGECGASLAETGAMTLARSGLITQVNQKALDLLGCKQKEMQGKPFSLFVLREDLVVFFSHLNELLNRSRKQSFELNLKHRKGNSIPVLLECNTGMNASKPIDEIHIFLSDISDNRRATFQMQYQQDLLNLVFTLSDHIGTASKKHLNQSLQDALKKVGLFAKADYSFIFSINRRLKRVEPFCQWCQPASSPAGERSKPKSVPLSAIKRTIVRLRQEKAYVVENVGDLAPPERNELLAWHQIKLGAVMCHLIYSGKHPIGVIGVAKTAADEKWVPECSALVKFLGQFIADRLPFSAIQQETGDPRAVPPAEPTGTGKTAKAQAPGNVIDINNKRPQSCEKSGEMAAGPAGRGAKASPGALPDMTRPMLLEKYSGRQDADQQPVFPRDDGLVLLTCPRCGFQESVSVGQLNKLGNAISIQCPCSKQFTAVLEKRHYYRKSVQLEGFFTLKGDLGAVDTEGSIWGPMVVQDLSKAGLRFSSQKAAMIHPGDFLMVRFNLDNSNQSLIYKPARVISVSGKAVGCRFEGSDSYDITLGFYFI